MAKLLTFMEFINNEFPWFRVDDNNHELIKLLSLWAFRDEKFENPIPEQYKIFDEGQVVQDKLFLRKGLLLIGSVGCGKTILLRLLNHYMRYLNSPFAWYEREVWSLADRINEVNEKEFATKYLNEFKKNNWMFDELCLLGMSTQPEKEMVNLFGTKLLIGSEVIRRREAAFASGYISAFTSNQPIAIQKKIYGEMIVSRLMYMCNVFVVKGPDRRLNSEPVQLNLNPNQFRHLNASEHISTAVDNNACVEIINEKFEMYKDGEVKQINANDYGLLCMLGMQPCTDQEFQDIYIKEATRIRRERILLPAVTRDEAARFTALKKMYENGKMDPEERMEITILAKRMAVISYFKQRKGQPTIVNHTK